MPALHQLRRSLPYRNVSHFHGQVQSGSRNKVLRAAPAF
jgi:hypothetical protein